MPTFEVHSLDDARRAFASFGPDMRRLGHALFDLMEAVQTNAQRAQTAKTPAEKVLSLETAKDGLRHLEHYIADVDGLELTALEPFRDCLDRMEQTFRAFGYYRMAGVQ